MIFAIDPGPISSGCVYYDDRKVVRSGSWDNLTVLNHIEHGSFNYLAIETITSYGMTVGKEIFDTCIWVGRFVQSNIDHREIPYLLVPRREVKTWLCGTPKAKDSNVRAALLEIFPGTGGGSVPQVGTKKQPGPLYGISGDKWSALALAVMVGGNADVVVDEV